MYTPKQILPFILTLALAACAPQSGSGLPVAESPSPAQATPTPTLAAPTPTPEPMAAIVNGEGITLAEFNAELERYKKAQTGLGQPVEDEQQAATTVLDDLIAQTLLSQAAAENGFGLDDAALQARIDSLAASLGGAEKLTAWQQAQGYSEPAFRAALKRAASAAWMRDQLIAAVPPQAEQIHVRQILLYNETAAKNILQQLQAGADFDQLATTIDPITRGDLGWFPRGYLLEASVEQVAFTLTPGQRSDIIASSVGFHIIKLLESDPARPLAPAALLAAQNRALGEWIAARRAQSAIILAP